MSEKKSEAMREYAHHTLETDQLYSLPKVFENSPQSFFGTEAAAKQRQSVSLFWFDVWSTIQLISGNVPPAVASYENCQRIFCKLSSSVLDQIHH